MPILFGLVALFIFFGVAIKYFKWYFLISGYNMMSIKQKENVDVKGLGNLMGNFMFLLAAVIGLSGYLQIQGYKSIATIIMLLMLPIIIVLLIRAQKFDHNKRKSKDKKIEYMIVVGLILLVLVITSGFLIVGIVEPKVEVGSDKVIISGLYKKTINTSDITEITLEENIPRVVDKINGFDFGYTLRGSFNLEGLGPTSIYIQENQTPFIVIKTNDRFFIINYKDPEKTKDLYLNLNNLK